ncbi:MAG: AzlC family ABC transporter permease [Pseudomonadota bacterium]
MSSVSEHHWRDGMRDALPIIMAIVPFAAVFGALATEAGWSIGKILFASATINAGASQYAMLELMGQNVPAWSVALAVLAINFRHVLYSASAGRYMKDFSALQKLGAFFLLTDPQFAASANRARETVLRPRYYFGYAAVIYVVWVFSNVVGALFGRLMDDPAAFGFDLILPIYFTGLVLGFRSRSGFLPVLAASILASIVVYFTLGSPWHISLGGVAGLVVAAVLSKPGDKVTLEPSRTVDSHE